MPTKSGSRLCQTGLQAADLLEDGAAIEVIEEDEPAAPKPVAKGNVQKEQRP